MLLFTVVAASALVVPITPAHRVVPALSSPAFAPRVAAHPTLQAPPAAFSPAKDISKKGGKYYEGRTPAMSEAVKQALREVGQRKVCVITGASSGLGLHAVKALTSQYDVRPRPVPHRLSVESTRGPRQRAALRRPSRPKCSA